MGLREVGSEDQVLAMPAHVHVQSCPFQLPCLLTLGNVGVETMAALS